MNYFMLIATLVVTPFLITAENKTLPKWEIAYRNFRLRNGKSSQKTLLLAESEHRPDYYNDKYNNYDYHHESYPRKGAPYNDDSYENSPHNPEYHRPLRNHANKDSEEEYDEPKEQPDSYEVERKHYNPYYKQSSSEDPYYKRDRPVYRKSHYNPDHLHDNVPLSPYAKNKYVPPAYPTRPFRHPYSSEEKQPYDYKEQHIQHKYEYSHYPTKPKEKYPGPYLPYKKQEYPSKYRPEYPAYTDNYEEPHRAAHSYHPGYTYVVHTPDPYYTSGTYDKDKTFRVPVNHDYKNSYNASGHHPLHYGNRNYHFVPSYGSPGFAKDKYSPKNYFSTVDSKESESYERERITSSESTYTDQTPLPSQTTESSFNSNKEELHQANAEEQPYDHQRPMKDDYHSAPLPDVSISSLTTEANANSTSTFNTSRGYSSIPQPSEDSSIKIAPPIEIPGCAQGTESSFCFHDTHYPFAKITDAISHKREDLLKILSEVEEEKFGKIPSRQNNTLCPSTIKRGSILRARNMQNVWKIIVKLPQNFDTNHYKQIVQLELCDQPGSLCDSNTKTITRCYQKYQVKKLLSWSPEESLHMDRFRLPVFCVCRPEKHKKKQQKIQKERRG